MSARRRAFHLSLKAIRDVDNLLLYTRRTWGKTQQSTYPTYRAVIYQALDMLSRHPQAGRPRDDLFPGCRSIQVEQHVIYFHQPRADEIEVLRILHHRQDASVAVQEPRS
jgi:toxin ParE1/3/4